MLSLRSDTKGEGLAGAFVLLATFVGFGVVIISATANLALSNKLSDVGGWDYSEGYQIIGDTTYTVLDPTAGYNVTMANTTDDWNHEGETNLDFSGVGYDDLVVGIIRDSADWVEIPDYGYWYIEKTKFPDYVMVYTEFGWWDNEDLAISYELILTNQLYNSNVSVTPFTIHDASYALIITTPGTADDFSQDLDLNIYNIKIADPAWGADDIDSVKSSSMWTILRQLMTASLPDIHPIINLMISIPFWSALAIMGYLFVRSLLPF